jgi:hypothetical protein
MFCTLMTYCMYGFTRDAQLQDTVNTRICTLHDVMEITNGQPWHNSSQYSVSLRGAKCHCHVAEFLLHKCKNMIKSKFRASNTLLNSDE